MLKRLKEQGITILVSTPYMDEATRCDRIALMQSGEILAVDTPASIINKYPERLYAVKSAEIPRLLSDLRQYENTLRCFSFGEHLHLSLRKEDGNALDELQEYLYGRDHRNVSITDTTPTIEDCFIRLLK
jgi:ABC-2 type transport system ATP-binding protein